MDAISLLKQDHRTVEELFDKILKTGDKALKQKQPLVDKLETELSKHMAIEEQLFYPLAHDRGDEEAKEDVLEAIEEHHMVKLGLKELDKLAPDAERFKAKVTVLLELVKHHVDEEEKHIFPTFKNEVSGDELNELGDELDKRKKAVPSRIDPYAPDMLTPRERMALKEKGRITTKALAARSVGLQKKTVAKKTAVKKTTASKSTAANRTKK